MRCNFLKSMGDGLRWISIGCGGVLTTFRDTLDDWKNGTRIEELKGANRALTMDSRVYKRKYEGEIAKRRDLAAEIKSLKASSVLAPVVPIGGSSVSIELLQFHGL